MTDGTIKVGSKQYYLKFSINTLCNLAHEGIDVLQLEGSFNFIILRALFFHALQEVHRKQVSTVEDAGDLMSEYLENGGDITELADILSNAITHALGQGTNNPGGK